MRHWRTKRDCLYYDSQLSLGILLLICSCRRIAYCAHGRMTPPQGSQRKMALGFAASRQSSLACCALWSEDIWYCVCGSSMFMACCGGLVDIITARAVLVRSSFSSYYYALFYYSVVKHVRLNVKGLVVAFLNRFYPCFVLKWLGCEGYHGHPQTVLPLS